jgi:hypothetical protein
MTSDYGLHSASGTCLTSISFTHSIRPGASFIHDPTNSPTNNMFFRTIVISLVAAAAGINADRVGQGI